MRRSIRRLVSTQPNSSISIANRVAAVENTKNCGRVDDGSWEHRAAEQQAGRSFSACCRLSCRAAGTPSCPSHAHRRTTHEQRTENSRRHTHQQARNQQQASRARSSPPLHTPQMHSLVNMTCLSGDRKCHPDHQHSSPTKKTTHKQVHALWGMGQVSAATRPASYQSAKPRPASLPICVIKQMM